MNKSYLLVILLFIIIFSCKREGRVNPSEILKPIDNIISTYSEPKQVFTIGLDTISTIYGKNGTSIHINPKDLDIDFDSIESKNIEVQLIEMTSKSNLILQNAQTVSNGEILVSGGAYFINVLVEGKEVQLKEGKTFKAEFPILTDEKMMLFIGEKDSLGQMNWASTNTEFQENNIERPLEPRGKLVQKVTYGNNGDMDYKYVYYEQEPATKKEMREYKRSLMEYGKKSKTYSSIELMDFGWINVDRFLYDRSPKIKVKLVVNNDSIKAARFYLVFNDINSIMSKPYWKEQTDTTCFKAIPSGRNINIVALSPTNNEPYFFQKEIFTTNDTIVNVDFKATKHKDLKKFLKSLD